MLYLVGCPACSAPALSSELICRHCGQDLTVPYKRLDHVRQLIKHGRGKWEARQAPTQIKTPHSLAVAVRLKRPPAGLWRAAAL